jgi:hypothetical protein
MPRLVNWKIVNEISKVISFLETLVNICEPTGHNILEGLNLHVFTNFYECKIIVILLYYY